MPNNIKRYSPNTSVLMPCLNAGQTLAEAVGSVQAQDYQDWELIIADDGSEDNSPEIIRELASEDARIRFLPPPASGGRTGAANTRNRALKVAQGRYIAFLDADDLWRPEKLSLQLEAMEAEGVPFCCSAYDVHQQGRGTFTRHVPKYLTRQTLLRGNLVGCLTAIYDSEQLGKQPMPDIRMRHDYALWLHLLTLSPVMIGIDKVLADHRRRPGSLSSGYFQASLATWKMLKNQAGLGVLGATYTTAMHSIRRLWRG